MCLLTWLFSLICWWRSSTLWTEWTKVSSLYSVLLTIQPFFPLYPWPVFEHLHLTRGVCVFQVHWILLFLCCCGCVCWAHWVLCWCHRGRTQCESWSSPLFCSWGSQWACSICWHSWELLMYDHKHTWEGFILSAYNIHSYTVHTVFYKLQSYVVSVLIDTDLIWCMHRFAIR